MSELHQLLKQDLLAEPAPEPIAALVNEVRTRFGKHVLGVVFYGSCRRRKSNEGLADLLVVVDSYSGVHPGPGMRVLNALLPPNVYYLQMQTTAGTQRCKYALVSMQGFARRCGGGIDAYFRARFLQPCRLLWSANHHAENQLIDARAAAVRTFAGEFAPRLQGTFSAGEFWSHALAASYRCELRPEPPDTAAALVAADAGYYEAISAAVLPGLAGVAQEQDRYRFQPTRVARWRARLLWAIRRPWSKLLNVLRLFKAASTFTGGIDYVLWKIERHSGVRIEATQRMRRWPRLSALGLAWKVWRQKALQ